MMGNQGVAGRSGADAPSGCRPSDGAASVSTADAASIPNAAMLTCIVCDREFDSAANDPNFDAVPYAGTLFYAHGHYGSTVFDPMDGTCLEIVVCDACLVERQSRVALVLPRVGAQRRLVWDDYASPEAAEHILASAIEARRAETGTGSVHESAVGDSRDAQDQSHD